MADNPFLSEKIEIQQTNRQKTKHPSARKTVKAAAITLHRFQDRQPIPILKDQNKLFLVAAKQSK